MHVRPWFPADLAGRGASQKLESSPCPTALQWVPTSDSKIKQSGVAKPLASTTEADICADPSGYYVNYHSTEFPDN